MSTATKYWFRPKTYGYGATPANWKGWAVTVAYVVAVLALALVWLPPSGAATTGDVVVWLAAIAVLTAPFVWLCRVKTDGEWRWRWGASSRSGG